ncbi:MAG: hypothetical protein SFU86_10865 [Pirellulaceae bacterium]|nr:hypothetical protein [Pirellulaceae bacterium]
MIPRPLLVVLVHALPILGLSFGVLLGASSLAQGLGDAGGAWGLFWGAMVALILLVIDALLLLAALGLAALDKEDPNRDGREP